MLIYLILFLDAGTLVNTAYIFLYISSVYIFVPLILYIIYCLIWAMFLIPCAKIFRQKEKDQSQIIEKQDKLPIEHVDLIKEELFNKNKYDKDDFCLVCWMNFEEKEPIKILPCNQQHHFHVDCIKQWFKVLTTCPICKQIITSELIQLQLNKSFLT